jgi:adenine-specific DNA-methyltransferase
METQTTEISGDLLASVQRLTDSYSQKNHACDRKKIGQVFTPISVARFMANFLTLKDGSPRLRCLDPGAGTGLLTAAFCERLPHVRRGTKLNLVAYETDPAVRPTLESVLTLCQHAVARKGYDCTVDLRASDFVLDNSDCLRESDLFHGNQASGEFDFVITNPPYYKLSRDSLHSMSMGALVAGQPNMYYFFVAVAVAMLKPQGQIVFISPRSFCTGQYFAGFREWLLERVAIRRIHLFESRREVFKVDQVLQESVILGCERLSLAGKEPSITVTASKDHSFDGLSSLKVSPRQIVRRQGQGLFLCVPTTSAELRLSKKLESWPAKLKDLGLEISTGPVVAFRAKEYLTWDTKKRGTVPLLWAHNMAGSRVLWPQLKNGKAPAMRLCDDTRGLVLPVRNYVLLKRFSSKEQTRRLYAAVLRHSDIAADAVGLENHLNYIRRLDGELTLTEAFGLAAIFNSTILDKYFRSLSGTTQVNACEVRALPLPKWDIIRRIGEHCLAHKQTEPGEALDSLVNEALGLDETGLSARVGES